MTHTPGPYTFRTSYSRGEPTGFVVSGKYENVADILLGSFGLEESEANARLIAAAPELLEALLKLREAFFVEGTKTALKAAFATTHTIIAQVEGKPCSKTTTITQ